MSNLAALRPDDKRFRHGQLPLSQPSSMSPRLRAYQILLWILFLGPPIAALFVATGIPFIADSGQLARDLLSFYVCPTPALSYRLFDAPMAVCARCWGATIGLWMAWLLARRPMFRPYAAYASLHWLLRLLIASTPFLLWLAEIRAWPIPWPGIAAPWYSVPLINGIQAGIFAGLFFYSLLAGRDHG